MTKEKVLSYHLVTRRESLENNLRQWSAIHNGLLKMLSGKIGLWLAKTRCMLFLFLFILVLQNQSSIDLWLLLNHRKKSKMQDFFYLSTRQSSIYLAWVKTLSLVLHLPTTSKQGFITIMQFPSFLLSFPFFITPFLLSFFIILNDWLLSFIHNVTAKL